MNKRAIRAVVAWGLVTVVAVVVAVWATNPVFTYPDP
jgi:hypothetical protein